MKKEKKVYKFVKISNGNSKLGPIANYSNTPGVNCSEEACRTCYKEGCYARDCYRMYPSVRKAWDFNSRNARTNLEDVEAELNDYFSGLNAPRFFRIHVGGDFFSKAYAEMWARVATNAPHTMFLAFTKQWDAVKDVEFPENFSLILSAWEGTEIPDELIKKYPVAKVIDENDETPDDCILCPGYCTTCGMCWDGLRKTGMNVCFHKH